MAAKPAGKFFDEQDDNAILASELIGKTVYDACGSSLGDINDVVWTKDRTIEGVIVGVGGFLGIGEKNVAVNYDALTVSTDENGDKKLVLDATADELAAAPEFKTTAEKVAELRAQQGAAIRALAGWRRSRLRRLQLRHRPSSLQSQLRTRRTISGGSFSFGA